MEHGTQCCHAWSVKILPWRVRRNNIVSVYFERPCTKCIASVSYFVVCFVKYPRNTKQDKCVTRLKFDFDFITFCILPRPEDERPNGNKISHFLARLCGCFNCRKQQTVIGFFDDFLIFCGGERECFLCPPILCGSTNVYVKFLLFLTFHNPFNNPKLQQ